jgi:hypothetical protein
MNGEKEEVDKLTEKDLIEMAKNHDERINRKTLVRCEDSDIKDWQTVAQTDELEFVREHLYKEPGKLIWPKPPEERKRVGVLLSFLFPGLGQLYLGQVLKGVCVLLGALFLGVITVGLLFILIWIVGMIDTHKLQKKLKLGQPIKQWEFF